MKTQKIFMGISILLALSFMQHPTFVKAEETDPLNSLQTFCNEVIRINGTEEGNGLLKELKTVRQQWKEVVSSDETREKGVEMLINTIQTCAAKKYVPWYFYQMLAQSKSPKALDFLLHEAMAYKAYNENDVSLLLSREYLGETGAEQAFDFLKEAAGKDTGLWGEQVATIKGLAKFGDRGADVIIGMIENKAWDRYTPKDGWFFELGKSGSKKAAAYLIDTLNKEPGDSERTSTILSSLMMLSRGNIGRAATIENFLAGYKNRPGLSEGNRGQAENDLAEVQRIKGIMEEAAKAKQE